MGRVAGEESSSEIYRLDPEGALTVRHIRRRPARVLTEVLDSRAMSRFEDVV
jgi:hypothetical protein